MSFLISKNNFVCKIKKYLPEIAGFASLIMKTSSLGSGGCDLSRLLLPSSDILNELIHESAIIQILNNNY